ncbi:hypothetical protein D3C76_1517580 [compost metagenome]
MSMAASARRRRSGAATPRASRPTSTFCSTVSQGNRAKLWNTMRTELASPWALLGKSTTPVVGEIRPAMERSKVDLPEPERPSRPTISPSSRRMQTLSRTRRSAPPAVP